MEKHQINLTAMGFSQLSLNKTTEARRKCMLSNWIWVHRKCTYCGSSRQFSTENHTLEQWTHRTLLTSIVSPSRTLIFVKGSWSLEFLRFFFSCLTNKWISVFWRAWASACFLRPVPTWGRSPCAGCIYVQLPLRGTLWQSHTPPKLQLLLGTLH